MMATIDDILKLAGTIGLTHLANQEIDMSDERVSNLDYLYNILFQEQQLRLEERRRRNRKRSRLPRKSFDYSNLSKGMTWQLDQIRYFDYINEIQNTLIIGKCRTGKTSLAADIGNELINRDLFTIYITFDDFVMCARTKKTPWRYLIECKVIIIDDLFYTTPTEEDLLTFYKAVTYLNELRSIICITNRDVSLWHNMPVDKHLLESLSIKLCYNANLLHL